MAKRKNSLLLSLLLCLVSPLQGESSDDPFSATSDENYQALAKLTQAQEALDKETFEHLKGWFIKERKALLHTNQDARRLLLASHKSLIEANILLAKMQPYIVELIQSFTKLLYTIRWSIIIFTALYVKNHLR